MRIFTFLICFVGFGQLLIGDEILDEFEAEYQQSYVADPISGYNRAMTKVNDVVYTYALIPVAKGYDAVMPDPIQGAFSNFFHNALYPVRLVNNLLQGKFDNSLNETKRFLINTTVGFAGFSDAAMMHYDIKRSDEDFGQTLGVWGVGKGFHVVLPILGPSNLRDSVGLVGDYFINPLTYALPHTDYGSQSIKAFEYLNEVSLQPDAYENMKKDALDLYIFMRDAYEQRRDYLIKE